MDRNTDESAFSAYAGAVPADEPAASSPVSLSYPTFDFKVMIVRAKDLLPSASAVSPSASVFMQMQVLDGSGAAIAPHFRYKSTVKPAASPDWCESVLLKHLPVQPCRLEFTFHLLQPSAAADSPDSSSSVLLGSLTTPASVIARYHPKAFTPDAAIYSRYHRITGPACGPNAQFHYALAPAYARLRHLTPTQALPPPLRSASPAPAPPTAAAAAAQPVSAVSAPVQPLPPQKNGVTIQVPSSSPPLGPRRGPAPAMPSRPPPPLVTQLSQSSVSASTHAASLPPLDTTTPQHGGGAGSLQFHPNPLLSPPQPLPPTPSTPTEADIAQEASMSQQDRERRAAMRARAVQEFFDTERSYFVNLGILHNEFVSPLKAAVKEGRLRLEAGQLDAIVSNIETIYNLHQSFLADLERKDKRAAAAAAGDSNGTSSSPSDSGAEGDGSVSSVILKYANFLKIYITYLNGYEASLSAITSLRSHRRFQEFLHRMRERLNEISILDLTSYLIMPVQRVPRYVLLLSEIRRHTGPLHPEYRQLCLALDSIKSVASAVNEGKRHVENLSKLVDVQDRVSGAGVPQLVEPYRRFIREGVMTRVSSGWVGGTLKEKKAVFFLFSDLLLWSSMDHHYKGSIWLVSACLDRRGKDGRQLEVTSAKTHLLVRCDSEQDWGSWADDLQRCIDELQAERNKHRILYRDIKTRRRQYQDTATEQQTQQQAQLSNGSSTPSGLATPVHSVDAAAAGLGGDGSTMHSMIAVRLRELQLKKEQEGAGGASTMGGDELSTQRASASVSISHTQQPSVSLDEAAPQVGGLERRAWRSELAAAASTTPNVCLCYDREEGRRNSAKFGKQLVEGSDEAKEMRRRCPLHQLPDA